MTHLQVFRAMLLALALPLSAIAAEWHGTVVGVADGVMKVDGKPIYEAKDLRVGLFVNGADASATV